MSNMSDSADYRALLQRSFLALRELQDKLDAVEQAQKEPIAIVGLGCRFPGGASSPEEFWQLLHDGVDAISEVPSDRWDIDAYYDPNPGVPGKMSTRWGGFLSGVDLFDAGFFGISPREAVSMDPQQRILLEVAWEALEHAGIPPDQLAGSKTGIFVGIYSSDYLLLQVKQPDVKNEYAGTGSSHSIVAGRLAYLLDLRGPGLAIDTACSSSLVSVHLACQSLRSGECNLALAAGLNLVLSPLHLIGASRMHLLSSDGRCKAFDARADGITLGDGCGVVVLKRLSDALADRDPILALIRGSAVNQDGRSAGLTAPNALSQQAVIKKALANAGVAAQDISYVEAHGTGTSLGDPIEFHALSAVLGRGRGENMPCYLGSVKTNVGHLGAAAGIAGLIKVVLSLQHREIPPHLHLQKLNPNIILEHTPFLIPRERTPWEVTDKRLYGGVSSFGWAGINAHIVLEEAPESTALPSDMATKENSDAQWFVLPLSARSSNALDTLTTRYQQFLEQAEAEATVSLQDICYSASVRRSHHNYRLAVIGRSWREIRERLMAFSRHAVDQGISSGHVIPGQRPRLVFVFPGQGSQWFGMGRELLLREPIFREQMQRCEEAFQRYVNWSLLDVLTQDEGATYLEEIDMLQPVLFAIQVSLAALWRSWGIEPGAVVGHSMGEIAAAQVAGSLSLEDAARIICCRSRLLRRVRGQGAMALVSLSLEDAQATLGEYADRVSVAVSNSSNSTVLAGEPDALHALLATFERQEIFCRLIKVDVASHSPQMDSLRTDLLKELAGLEPHSGTTPLYSTVYGRRYDGNKLDANYWVRNLREPVRFAEVVQHLLAEGPVTFLEVSPHPILVPAIEQEMRDSGHNGRALSSLKREEDEQASLLTSLAALYTLGHLNNWHKIYPAGGRYTPLPSYPWQHERFWLEEDDLAELKPATLRRSTSHHPLLGDMQRLAGQPGLRYWELDLNPQIISYLNDHRLYGVAVFPAAGYIDIVLASAAQIIGGKSPIIEDIFLQKPLVLLEDVSLAAQCVFHLANTDEADFQVFSQATGISRAEDEWDIHAVGHVRLVSSPPLGAEQKTTCLDEVRLRCSEEVDCAVYYQSLNTQGFEYGPCFQGIVQLWRRPGEALAQIQIAEDIAHYHIHPALLDACFQVLGASVLNEAQVGSDQSIYLPLNIEQVSLYQRPGAQVWCHARIRESAENGQELVIGDFDILDADGHCLVEIRGLHLKRTDKALLQHALANGTLDWLYKVDWVPLNHKPHWDKSSMTSWIILADQLGVGAELAAYLQSHGETCLLFSPPVHIDQERYRVSQEILEAVTHHQGGIIYLWGLDLDTGQEFASLDQQEYVCGSLLTILQHLAETNTSTQKPARIWIGTRGVQPIGLAQEPVLLEQAPLWGMGRVLSQEHPDLWGGMVDLDPASSCAEAATHLASYLHMYEREDQVAWREGQLYGARLHHYHISQEQGQMLAIHPQATYMISGGMGGLGLETARWLVKQGARCLVLLGRKGPDAAAKLIIADLVEMGVRVECMQVDVTCQEQLATVFSTIEEQMPPLRGIIHAAGVLDDGVIVQQNWERFARVLAPKIIGGWLLHTLSTKYELDFFVLYSSAASVLGSAGQSNHAAANAFLDDLAHYRRYHGLPSLSINWGAWAEVGAAAEERVMEHINRRGIGTMTPAQGIEALELTLSQIQPQIVVLPIRRLLWQELFAATQVPPLVSDLVHSNERASYGNKQRVSSISRDELLKLEPNERRQRLEKYLCEEVARVLRFPKDRQLDAYQPLNTLGIDSLMAIELRNRVQTDLKLTIPLAILIKGPSMQELASKLLELLATESLFNLNDENSPQNADDEDWEIVRL